jgi:hypothetical protein
MKTRARFGRDFVAIAATGFFAASIAACEGGSGQLPGGGFGLADAPATDSGYNAVSGVPGGSTPAATGDGATPGATGGLPSPGGDAPPGGGGGDCGAVVARVLSCFPDAPASAAEDIANSCAKVPAACVSCIVGTWTCDDFQAETPTKCAAVCGGSVDPGSGGSGGGGGGGGAGGGPPASCKDVVDAFVTCDASTYGSEEVKQFIQQSCAPYSGSCRACVAKLSCSQLSLVAGDQIEETSCAGACSEAGGSSGSGGGSGSSGSGGGSSGDCASTVAAKAVECGQSLSAADAAQICELAPSCGTCFGSFDCNSLASGACESVCGGSDTGGSSGSGGGSSGGCASSVVAKAAECGQSISPSDAQQICDLAPACGACLGGNDCASLESGVCDSVCKG